MEAFVDRLPIRRYRFTLRDMMLAFVALGILMFLLLPAIRAAQEGARRNRCVNNIKQIVLGLHNYHELYRQLPNLTTTEIRGVAPAAMRSVKGLDAGYSWLVSVLPYLEEKAFYNDLEKQSRAFALSAFDPSVKPKKSGTVGLQGDFASRSFDTFRCPSSRDGRFAVAPEYLAIGPQAIARCNYTALSATHLDCMIGDPRASEYVAPNGVLVPGPTIVRLKSIVDGTSKTLMLAETRERGYTSWYDGTVGWTVAAAPTGSKPLLDKSGALTAPANTITSLNVGPGLGDSGRCYLPATLHPTISVDWEWGPSSEHVGAVVHAVADGSVRSITDDIDTTLYLQLITREGHEPTGCTCE